MGFVLRVHLQCFGLQRNGSELRNLRYVAGHAAQRHGLFMGLSAEFVIGQALQSLTRGVHFMIVFGK